MRTPIGCFVRAVETHIFGSMDYMICDGKFIFDQEGRYLLTLVTNDHIENFASTEQLRGCH